MPIYHFHDVSLERNVDDEGTDLRDDSAAKLNAVAYAGQMLADDPKKLWKQGQWRVEVTDDTGALRWTVITLAVDAPYPDNP